MNVPCHEHGNSFSFVLLDASVSFYRIFPFEFGLELVFVLARNACLLKYMSSYTDLCGVHAAQSHFALLFFLHIFFLCHNDVFLRRRLLNVKMLTALGIVLIVSKTFVEYNIFPFLITSTSV